MKAKIKYIDKKGVVWWWDKPGYGMILEESEAHVFDVASVMELHGEWFKEPNLDGSTLKFKLVTEK